DNEFDPDDNFASGADSAPGIDEDAGTEALVWQLLLLINPGDEDTAMQQFAAWQDAVVDAGDEEIEPAWVLKDIIDWKSGFQVQDDDAIGFVESINELAARWNVEIDWGIGDPDDDEGLSEAAVSDLLQPAYDTLRAYGYTLWVWETGTGTIAGWITLSRD